MVRWPVTVAKSSATAMSAAARGVFVFLAALSVPMSFTVEATSRGAKGKIRLVPQRAFLPLP